MKPFGKGGVLVTREAGVRARHDLERAIASLTPGDPVALDFAEVVAVSVPFADECLGQLLSGRLAGFYEDHPILAMNANADVAETIAAALRRRKLVLLGLFDGRVELLGADALLNETMEVAHRLAEFSASDLAEELGLTLQAANNRLKALLRAGAVSRTRGAPEGGGREYEYQVPTPPTGSGLAMNVPAANGGRAARRRREASSTSNRRG